MIKISQDNIQLFFAKYADCGKYVFLHSNPPFVIQTCVCILWFYMSNKWGIFLRRLLSFTIATLFIPAFLMIVYAHPGRTDANGGHTDSSTGQYHYHHGYSAHQHQDMNGDGVPDCPYDFKDKTSDNSRPAISATKPTATIATEAITIEKPTYPVQTAAVNKASPVAYSDGKVGFAIAFFSVITTLISWIVSTDRIKYRDMQIQDANQRVANLRNEIGNLKSEHENAKLSLERMHSASLISMREQNKMEMARTENHFKKIINDQKLAASKLNEKLAALYGPSYLLTVAGAKSGTYFGTDKLPHRITQNGEDEYVFYVTSSFKYHKRSCQYSSCGNAIHATDIEKTPWKYVACCNCKPELPDMSWIPKYKEYKDFFQLSGDMLI